MAEMPQGTVKGNLKIDLDAFDAAHRLTVKAIATAKWSAIIEDLKALRLAGAQISFTTKLALVKRFVDRAPSQGPGA